VIGTTTAMCTISLDAKLRSCVTSVKRKKPIELSKGESVSLYTREHG